MMIVNKKWYTISIIWVFTIIMAGLWFYNDYIQERLGEQNCNTLKEILAQQMFNIDSKLAGDKLMIESYARLIGQIPLEKSVIQDTLNELTRNSSFEIFVFAYPDGKAFNNRGDDLNIAGRDYFREVLKGKTIISEPIQSKVRDAIIIAIATPVYKDSKVVGVLVGSYKTNYLDDLFLQSFDGMGYSYLTTNSGKIIAKSTNALSLIGSETNVFKVWEQADFYMHDDLVTIYKNLANNIPGHARYDFKNEKRYLHYDTIATNNWNVFSIVPEQAAIKTSRMVMMASFFITTFILISFLCFFLIILYVQKKHIRQLENMVYFDELTGIPSLTKFKLDAAKILANNPNAKFLIVKNDVANFKLVNQSLGFNIGNKVLCGIAYAFNRCIKTKNEIIARTNTDEFLYLHEFISQEDFIQRRDTFIHNFHNYMGNDFTYNIKFVAGHYRLFTDNCTDISRAFECVNLAHRFAKQNSLETCEYNNAIFEKALVKRDIENRMEKALSNNEFKVFLQPQYRLSDETIAGAEALVRWKADGLDIAYPGSFIPIFEENGFITKLDMYMFEKVCAIIKGWIDTGIKTMPISVNFSRHHLNNDSFVQELCHITNKYKVPHNLLEIELLESTIFENEDILEKVLEKLHDENFYLSMDDFGTGYSSLGLLKNIPVDIVKIDRSFFTTTKDAVRAKSVISNIIRMTKELGIITIAEGVETKSHAVLLKELGCDMVQGYYYAKPMPEEEFTYLIKSKVN